jgi:hypothetical protein
LSPSGGTATSNALTTPHSIADAIQIIAPCRCLQFGDNEFAAGIGSLSGNGAQGRPATSE